MNSEVFRIENPAVGEKMNNSNLAPADCWNRLANENYSFEEMSIDDLDSIYRIAFDRWAYHLTREGYIKMLYEKRNDLKLRDEIANILRDGITFSPQIERYVIHGAIDAIIELIKSKTKVLTTPNKQ